METLIQKMQEINIESNKSNILEPCEILDFINIDILKKYVKTDIDGNKEYYDDCNKTYKISNPKKAEWILSKAIPGSKLVGDGNKYIDIEINNIGIDVSVLTLNNNYTNEKSIMQNFANSNDMDSLFDIENINKVFDVFKKTLCNKYKKDDNSNIKDIYYLIFICKNQNVYLSCLKFNSEYIDEIKYSKLSKMCKTLTITNFIDEKYGNVILYKSKKRLELRLSKDIINNARSIKIF